MNTSKLTEEIQNIIAFTEANDAYISRNAKADARGLDGIFDVAAIGIGGALGALIPASVVNYFADMAKDQGLDGAAIITKALSELCQSIGIDYADGLLALGIGAAIAGAVGAAIGFGIKSLIDWGLKRLQTKKINAKFEMFKSANASLQESARVLLGRDEYTDYDVFRLLDELESMMVIFGIKFDDLNKFIKKVNELKFIESQEEIEKESIDLHANLLKEVLAVELKSIPDEYISSDLDEAYMLLSEMGINLDKWLNLLDVENLSKRPQNEMNNFMKKYKQEIKKNAIG